MDITIFKMDNEYICSSNAEEGFDFEDLCNKLVSFCLKELLFDAVPRLNLIKDQIEIKVEWIYEGYRVFIFGEKLSDNEIIKFVERLDPIKKIGICDLFWNRHTEQREYSGVVLAYDMKHYHKAIADTHKFIILTYNGLDEFLEILGMSHKILPLDYERHMRKLHFVFDKNRDREIRIQKLSGAFVLPQAEIVPQGKMHTRINRKSHFNDYWDKKLKKDM